MGPIGLILVSALATAGAAEVAWDTIIRLTTNSASQVTGYSSQHSVAVDGAGNVHVAWLDQRTVPYQVWYRRYDAGTSAWLAETTLTTQQANCAQPGLACDSAGNVHLAWHVGNWNPLGVGIWSKRYNATTHHWRADTLIDSTSTSQPQQYPSVACVPGAGNAEVAWYGSPDTGMFAQVFLKERHPAAGWDSAMQVSSASASHDQVSVAVGTNGDLAVVWCGMDFGADRNQVFCRRRAANVWQDVELVSDLPGGLTQNRPCVAIDRSRVVHVVWYGMSGSSFYQQVFHRMRDSTGWSGVVSISGERPYQQQFPSIACDAAGRCHAVWCSPAGSEHVQLVYGQRDTDGVWSSPMILTGLDSGDVSYPSVACDADSGVHVVWYDASSGNQDVYYLRGFTPGAAIAEMPNGEVRVTNSATVVCGMLVLGAVDSRQNTGYMGDLLDISGRNVLDLHPGANDVRALAPGVYFVLEEPQAPSHEPQAVRKVVIQR